MILIQSHPIKPQNICKTANCNLQYGFGFALTELTEQAQVWEQTRLFDQQLNNSKLDKSEKSTVTKPVVSWPSQMCCQIICLALPRSTCDGWSSAGRPGGKARCEWFHQLHELQDCSSNHPGVCCPLQVRWTFLVPLNKHCILSMRQTLQSISKILGRVSTLRTLYGRKSWQQEVQQIWRTLLGGAASAPLVARIMLPRCPVLLGSMSWDLPRTLHLCCPWIQLLARWNIWAAVLQ